MKNNLISLVVVIILLVDIASAQDTQTNDVLGVYSDKMKSFDEPPYFSPLILLDFAGWESDGADEVVISSVDLLNALLSNRYYHNDAREVIIDGEKWVYAENDTNWARYCAEEIEQGFWAVRLVSGGLVSGPLDGKLAFRDNLLMSLNMGERYEWHPSISRMRVVPFVLLTCEGKLPFDFFESSLSITDIFSEEDGKPSHLGQIYEDGLALTKLAAQHPDFMDTILGLLNGDTNIMHSFLSELPDNLDQLKKLAENGHTDAQLELAGKFYTGDGVSLSSSDAIYWNNQAAENGSILGLFNNGVIYLYGNADIDKDFDKAYEFFVKASELGHKESFDLLGLVKDGSFENWENIPTDIMTEGWEVAGESGNLGGFHNLGDFYYYGNNGSQVEDFKKGFDYYLKAAELGYAESQFMVGWCYENGTGVLKDIEKANEWYLEAANQDHANAYFRLGLFYNLEELTENNIDKVSGLYLKAANLGHIYSMFNYGLCCLIYHNDTLMGYENEDERFNGALYWFEEAGSFGHTRSQNLSSSLNLQIDNKARALAWGLLSEDELFFDIIFEDIEISDELMNEAVKIKETLIKYADGEGITGTPPDYTTIYDARKSNQVK